MARELGWSLVVLAMLVLAPPSASAAGRPDAVVTVQVVPGSGGTAAIKGLVCGMVEVRAKSETTATVARFTAQQYLTASTTTPGGLLCVERIPGASLPSGANVWTAALVGATGPGPAVSTRLTLTDEQLTATPKQTVTITVGG